MDEDSASDDQNSIENGNMDTNDMVDENINVSGLLLTQSSIVGWPLSPSQAPTKTDFFSLLGLPVLIVVTERSWWHECWHLPL